MTQWSPDWTLTVNGGTDYTNLTLANLTITSGRTDIYQQPVAGYCNVEIINTDETNFSIDINDQITIKVKDTTGSDVTVFGGSITDIYQEVRNAGSAAIVQVFRLTALGALARLPKVLTDGVLASDYDGDQMFELLSGLLYANWISLSGALAWNGVESSLQWTDAFNTGLGDIDRPGDYELDQRDSNRADAYSIAQLIATSGLGYLYEGANGTINYADSTHRNEYLSANGYVDLDANQALWSGLRTVTRAGDVRNSVTLKYKKAQNLEVSDSDAESIATYGSLGQVISTTLKNQADAESQAAFYLTLRAYPQTTFDQITFALTNPEVDDSDRNSLIGVFMGMPVNITNLPANMNDGEFQGFVEGWTFRAGYNTLSVTLTVSALAYSLQAFRWNSVPASETWNTISPTLDWLNATIIA